VQTQRGRTLAAIEPAPTISARDRRPGGERICSVDRREFLGLALASPLALPALASRPAFALATADTEGYVAVVALASGRVQRRVATLDGPRSIEARGAGPAVVAHTSEGAVTLLEDRPPRVRRVLHGFGGPRYAAVAPGGRYAFVTDSGHGELAVIDLPRGRVVRRVGVDGPARHLALDPAGRTLWVVLGSSARTIVVVDVTAPLRPRVRVRLDPPFLAHDVGFSPSGRRVWVTAGRERRLAIYPARERRASVLLAADAAPQHVTFGPRFAYVASGEGPSLRVHALADGRLLHEARTPYGSYNVQRRAGRVLTPSLASGQLTALNAAGRVLWRTTVAPAAHDACVVL
jgi:DNA-binding beta-propeller fold protein YncE